jgi:hypothetical protein
VRGLFGFPLEEGAGQIVADYSESVDDPPRPPWWRWLPAILGTAFIVISLWMLWSLAQALGR